MKILSIAILVLLLLVGCATVIDVGGTHADFTKYPNYLTPLIKSDYLKGNAAINEGKCWKNYSFVKGNNRISIENGGNCGGNTAMSYMSFTIDTDNKLVLNTDEYKALECSSFSYALGKSEGGAYKHNVQLNT